MNEEVENPETESVTLEDSSESDRDAKQRFLHEEIIGKNYDPRLFTLYCESVKSANIDLWTLPELTQCVSGFQSKYPINFTLEQLNDPGVLLIASLPRLASELSTTPSITVTVSEPKLMASGIFTSNFAVYTVKTLPFQWEVQRSFNDFHWLRKALLSTTPGVYLPPLPKVKNRGDLNDSVLYSRKICLEKFMNVVISHQLLLRDDNLKVFLKLEAESEFEKYKASEESNRIEGLGPISSTDGKTIGDLVDHSEYVKKMQEYCKRTKKTMKSLKEKAYQVVEEYKIIIEDLEKIVQTIKKLKEIQSSFQFSAKFEALYAILDEHIKNIIGIYMRKTDCINQHFGVFFKYCSMEWITIQSFVTYGTGFADVYRKELIKDSKKIAQAREMYAYFNAQCIKECTRIGEIISDDGFNNFYEFCRKQADSEKEWGENWKRLMEQLDFT
jgi:hypothetical protein